MSIHTFGPVTVDTSALPQASIDALVKRGLSHFFGNEVASKVTAKKNRHVEDKEKNPEATPLTDDEITALRNEFIQSGFKALTEGTVGQHTPRAAVDPMEAEVWKLAKRDATAKLKAQGMKFPRGEEVLEFPNGQKLTGDEFIEMYIEKYSEALNKEAKKNLADKARREKAAKEAVKAEFTSAADIL